MEHARRRALRKRGIIGRSLGTREDMFQEVLLDRVWCIGHLFSGIARQGVTEDLVSDFSWNKAIKWALA